MRDALYVVGGLAIVVFFIVRQLRSDRFEQRSLIFPVGLGIYGAVILNGTSKHHPVTAASAGLLGLSAVASVAFGVIRGRTIELFERDGELGERAYVGHDRGVAWLARDTHRHHRRRHGDRCDPRRVRLVDPAHARRNACNPDDRGRPARQGNRARRSLLV